MAIARIIAMQNGKGVERSSRIIAGVLRDAGWLTQIWPLEERRLARRVARRLSDLLHPVEANIFYEFIDGGLIPRARRNYFVPNPEWLRPETEPWLARMDLILCKSRDAADVMGRRGLPTAYVSFTSEDRFDGTGPRMDAPLTALHVAGTSEQKGTYRLAETWVRHPEWPPLTIVWRTTRPGVSPPPSGANVKLVTHRLKEDTLRQLQNRHALHICPSEVEGFGHTLVEGLSCQAVVITTDAPPMNEIIAPDRGVLIGWSRQEARHAGTAYYSSQQQIEEAVGRVLALAPADLARLGRRGREWFLENDRRFRAAMVRAIGGA